jgi:predicted AlkP superfamily phosphohydrolase/phosphomutase
MSDGGRADRRLLMIALDSVSLPFIRDHLDRLPILKSLFHRGECRLLETSAKYLSASPWPTFTSGLLPGEHGHYYPFQWDAEKHLCRRVAKPVWSRRFEYEPFWHPITRQGVPTIAFDIPYVAIDSDLPCLQISHWSYQSTGAAETSHPEVLDEIRRRFGRRPIGAEVPVPKTARQCNALRDTQIRAAKAKGDAILHLLDRPWRLFLTGFYEGHRAGHNLWPVAGDFASDAAPDSLFEVYEEMDRQVGRILEYVERDGPDTSVMLFSLHGMEPNRAQNHFLVEIIDRLNRSFIGDAPPHSGKARVPNIMSYLRTAVPPTLQYHAARLLGEDIQDWVLNRALVAGCDWTRTPSLVLPSGGEGLIRLNIKGRERYGFFEPGSATLDRYIAWLRDRLAEIRVAATGEPLIDKILLSDEHFPGPRRQYLPDIVLSWRPDAPAERVTSPEIGEIEMRLNTGRGGNHVGEAFFVATGTRDFLANARDIRHIAALGGLAAGYFGQPAAMLNTPLPSVTRSG